MHRAFRRQPYLGKIQWIAPKNVEQKRACTFRARKIVPREELDPEGLFYVAAESYYALYINGHRVGLGPARGTMSCNFIDTLETQSYLQPGNNHIAIEIYCDNIPNFRTAPAEPALFVASGKLIADETWEVQTAREYRTEDVPKYTLQIGVMEWRDQALVPQGWPLHQDDSNWETAQIITSNRPIYQKSLYFRDVLPLELKTLSPIAMPIVKALDPLPKDNNLDVAMLMTTEPHHQIQWEPSDPLTILPPADHDGIVIIFDMGQEFIGHLDFQIDAPAGTLIDVGYQEEIENERLKLAVSHYRFADRYVAAEGPQQIGSPLRWRGGRYLQMAFRQFDRPITLGHVHIQDHRYPIEELATFQCDDPFYNDLWERCQATLSACATDTIMDCPWREMAFWVNDFVLVNRYWLQLVGRPDLVRRCIALALSQRDQATGLIPGVCPYDGREFFCLFATNLFLPAILKDYVQYTGDTEFAATIIDEMVGIIGQCESYADETGLLRPAKDMWNFVDWSFELAGLSLGGRNSCIVNWFYVLALDSLAELYTSLNETNLAATFANKARMAAQKIDHYFWDESKQCYREWITSESEEASPLAGKLTHALAIISGHTAPAKQPAVEQALLREDLPLPELYMMHYLFEALEKQGDMNVVHQLIQQHWGSILASDCPTIWEANVYQHGKQRADDNHGSLCHAFAIAPASMMQQFVLGVMPLDPGFTRVAINPQLGSFTQIQGSIPTPHGMIHLACKKTKDLQQLTLTIPKGISAIMPNGTLLGQGTHQLEQTTHTRSS